MSPIGSQCQDGMTDCQLQSNSVQNHNKQNRNSLNYNQNLVWSRVPKGITAKTDWLTD